MRGRVECESPLRPAPGQCRDGAVRSARLSEPRGFLIPRPGAVRFVELQRHVTTNNALVILRFWRSEV